MPKEVDHNAQREKLVNVAASLIAAGGMERFTIRAVARAAGVSTGVVSHYFRDKRQLMKLTFVAVALRIYAPAAKRLDEKEGDAQWCLEGLLPLDKERHKCWRVYVAYWGMAIGGVRFARVEQRQQARNARDLVKRILGASVSAGKLKRDLNLELSARYLLSVVLGISAQSVFDPKRWPPKRQIEVLGQALQSLGT